MSQAPEPSAKSQPKPDPKLAPPRSRLQALLGLLRQLGGILLAFVPLLWQGALKLLSWLGQIWALLLPKVRAILPAAGRNLPDAVITAVAAILLVLLIWIPTALLGHEPAAANQVASQPAKAPIAAPKPDRNAARLAKLQTQISEAVTQQADPYGIDLVQAVQANFASNHLTVSLADRWYGLTRDQRHQLAELLLKQAKKQGFDQVEVVDLKGSILARPAVVGSGMVVLADA